MRDIFKSGQPGHTNEGSFNETRNNQKYDKLRIQKFIKQIAKILFKDSIYLSQIELKEVTETFLKNEHPDFFKKFKNNQWMLYYERNVY